MAWFNLPMVAKSFDHFAPAIPVANAIRADAAIVLPADADDAAFDAALAAYEAALASSTFIDSCCDPTQAPYDCHECAHQFDAPCCCVND